MRNVVVVGVVMFVAWAYAQTPLEAETAPATTDELTEYELQGRLGYRSWDGALDCDDRILQFGSKPPNSVIELNCPVRRGPRPSALVPSKRFHATVHALRARPAREPRHGTAETARHEFAESRRTTWTAK
jgi:hypothetical protein